MGISNKNIFIKIRFTGFPSSAQRSSTLGGYCPKSIGDEEKKRFKREAKAAAALNHPNIATIFAIDEVDGQLFIAMEFIEGQSLQEIVGANGGSPMPIDKAIDYVTQTAAGLQAAHEKGITHRDIKSANIMLTDKGVVKIMDFGLAKLANRSKANATGHNFGHGRLHVPGTSAR